MIEYHRYLGACMGLGAQIKECEDGPQALFPEIEALFPPRAGSDLARITIFKRTKDTL